MEGFGGMFTLHGSFFMEESVRTPKLHHKITYLGLIMRFGRGILK
jgi:hypothetical protein